MKIAAAYVRVSDERQDEYSPDSQLKLIREHAKRNDYYVPDEYVFFDDGKSAKSAIKRTQFNNMIALAKDKSHPFSAIFVWKFSRFARNQEESIVYKNLLRKNNVSVISISEPLGEDNPFSSLIERIIEWMDEFYLIRLSDEVKRGMLEKATRGEAMCHPAFGYDLKDKKYYPNADSAVVKRIFNSYINGKGFFSIARELGTEGVRTYRGGIPDNRWIEYIINNPVYNGKIRWSKDGRAASRRDYDNPNIIVVDGKHEAIIDDETWNKAQNRYREQKKKYGKFQRPDSPVEFMLKGLVRCGSCGSMLVNVNKGKAMQCHMYSKGVCKVSHHISLHIADDLVIKGLEKALAFTRFPIEPETKDKADTPKIDYDKFISAEKLKLKRCKEAYQNGVDTLDEYKQNKADILSALSELKKKRDEDSRTETPQNDTELLKIRVADVLKIIKDPNISPASKNQALRSIVSKIVFNKEEKQFNIFFYT